MFLEHSKEHIKLATYNENSKEKTRRYIRSQPLQECAQRESIAPAVSPLVKDAARDESPALLQQRKSAFQFALHILFLQFRNHI